VSTTSVEDDAEEADSLSYENATPAELIPLLDMAYRNKPTTDDSDRPKTYTPRNPCTVPSCFPTAPLPVERNFVEKKLDIDTLFFIFYQQQGSYQQYQAARQLKKQSWRYHKKVRETLALAKRRQRMRTQASTVCAN